MELPGAFYIWAKRTTMQSIYKPRPKAENKTAKDYKPTQGQFLTSYLLKPYVKRLRAASFIYGLSPSGRTEIEKQQV